MSRPLRSDPKVEALREEGAVNRRPEAVTDPLFQENAFFDPRDLVQVKYEMLRRAGSEGASVASAASAFGFSRVAFYQARKRFEEEGVAGLLPKRPGPRGAHKLSEEVMGFLETRLADDPSLKAPRLAELVRERFSVTVHPRSIDRALARRGKKGRPWGPGGSHFV